MPDPIGGIDPDSLALYLRNVDPAARVRAMREALGGDLTPSPEGQREHQLGQIASIIGMGNQRMGQIGQALTTDVHQQEALRQGNALKMALAGINGGARADAGYDRAVGGVLGAGLRGQSAEEVAKTNAWGRVKASQMAGARIKPTILKDENGLQFALYPGQAPQVLTDEQGDPLLARKDVSNETIKDVSNMDDTVNALHHIKTMAKQLGDKYPGLGKSSAGFFHTMEALGQQDPEVAKFAAELGMHVTAYQKSIAGARMSDNERRFLASLQPNLGEPLDVLLSKADNAEKDALERKATRLNAEAQGGRNIDRFSGKGKKVKKGAAPVDPKDPLGLGL